MNKFLLGIFMLMVACSPDKVLVNTGNGDDNSAKIKVLQAEQQIIKERLTMLELAQDHTHDYSELESAYEMLLSMVQSLETQVETNSYDISVLNEIVNNIYFDLDTLREAVSSDFNCGLENRNYNEESGRADVYVVCDNGEYLLKNNAKLE